MRKYILVDTENVSMDSLRGIEYLSENDCIILFISGYSCLHYTDTRLKKLNYKCKLHKIQVKTGEKNSLDFQLVTYLGILIGEHKHIGLQGKEYYIVSHDMGFLSSINLLNSCSVEVSLIPNLRSCLGENFNKDITKEEYLFENLSKIFRPITVQKILLACSDCTDIIDVKNSLLNAFNFNPSVYMQSESIFKEYFNHSKTA